MAQTAGAATKKAAPQPRAKKAKELSILAIKGMDHSLRCRGFQFEVGKSYEVSGKIVACSNGFHSCPIDDDSHPFSVFEYYAPGVSRYFEVEAKGETDRQGSKIASAKITIGVEVSIGELTRRAIEWVFARAKPEGESATGYQGAASATGTRGAASATGDYGAASATGDYGAASATGAKSAAMASGYDGRVKAAGGCALFALERDGSWNITSTASGIVGRDGLKADTFYRCVGGQLVEAA